MDACYQEQAAAYEQAARLAEESIQTYMPRILNAAAQAIQAGADRDTASLRDAGNDLDEESDNMLADGEEFTTMMDEADAICD